MPAEVKASIEGLQKAQDRNLRRVAAMRRGAEYGARDAAIALHRYAVQITHVDSGAWRASHRVAVEGPYGRVYLAPTARHPKSGTLVTTYANVWGERGGRLAIYRRTRAEEGPRVMHRYAVRILEEVQRA